MTARVWSARGPVLLGLLTLVTLIGGFGAWSVLATITGAIVSSGQIQVEQNRQVVQHPDGGVVEAIAVTEGQAVAAGDLLVRLDGSLLQSELAIVEGQFVETRARRARLEAERDDAARITIPPDLANMAGGRPDIAEQIEGQLRLFDARRDTLARQTEQMQKRLLQIGAQNQGLTAQAQALTTQLRVIGDELASQRELLANGLTQSSRVSALEREEADLLGRAGELTAARAQNEGRATEIDLEILRLAAARREEASTQLRDIGQAELELAERRRALTERIARLDIRAPVSGLVLGLQVTTPRAVIRPADPVLYLIPQDRPLVIAVNIQPIHIDEVHIGQDVRLMFPAFSSRTTPELMGKVAVVSADALTDQASGMTFYRAEIVLNPGEVEKLQGRTLLPGMPVETFIQTAARTPLAYLVQPFTDYFQAAFRES
jgi:HlyD family secretion protein